MKLAEILEGVALSEVRGSLDIEITGVQIDSRRVEEGNLFIAVRGSQADGHDYIAKALENGAAAVLCEDMAALAGGGCAGETSVAVAGGCVCGGASVAGTSVTAVRVPNTEQVTGQCATNYYGDPTKRVRLVGVTGTNGKTTIATLLYHLFRRLGYKCGLCSTVCNYIDGTPYPTEQTTPDPITLNQLLAKMDEEGCEFAFMEVSSHAVVQNRIGGLTFAGGIFTNLTRDHLDYHKTFEAYRDAKKLFFDRLPEDAFAITNADDRNGMFMLQNTRAEQVTYSTRQYANFTARILEESFEGMLLDMRCEYKDKVTVYDFLNEQISHCHVEEVSVPFIGRFNVSNLLAVYAAAVMIERQNSGGRADADNHQILVEMSTLRPVNGRFETIRSPKGVTAIVDYAHTPDALVNVLTTINEILQGRGQCITVCGCGGNRDKGKRPIMAREAANNSDRLIVTSDNPRNEEPQDIINDMLAGLDAGQMERTIAIADRREAIRAAVMMARAGDVILIAGKGHEDYQIVKGVKHHFDDHEVVSEAFGL